MLKMDEFLKNQIFATHAVAAAGSVTLSTALTYPLDTIKTLIQVGSDPLGSGKQLTTTQALHRIQSFSGNSGLYSGFGWLAFGRLFGLGARFGVYEIVTAYYKDGREDDYVHVSEALLGGLMAGAAESLICSPFELVKLRAQVTSAIRLPSRVSLVGQERALAPSMSRFLHGYTLDLKALNHSVGLLSTLTTKHQNIKGALQEYPWMMTGSGRPPAVSNVHRPSDIISLEGWQAFWRGLRSGIARDSIFSGVFFSTWQFLHRSMLIWKSIEMDPPPRSNAEVGPLSPFSVSLAAGVSGAVAAAVSHGFDTANSRSLCTVLPKYVAMERKFLKWHRPGNRFERTTGIHPADRSLLFRGIGLRMARCGLGSFFMVGGYYLILDHLLK
ncbi:mitochondrial arginine transporter BAC2 isoform X1 [Cucurbita pepo subsp. pepo]|uniref:mitochondrial arginine transporter BAC2 isoform X1 n=1 Tax=Cucurbita pepo subsp. pepo TaxID=3664 RepID=UPI000C9D420D|nr:mitochondrial arginine transporter BAC2 isoform X1 [Cucurbita pepo subsp. pepo]